MDYSEFDALSPEDKEKWVIEHGYNPDNLAVTREDEVKEYIG
jgi:hypothetical protein